MSSASHFFTPKILTTLSAYGQFMVFWSVLEVLIEVAIMKRIAVPPLEGAIITASLGFQARSNILKSLLALDKSAQSEEAIKAITAAAADANRNTIIHGHVFAKGDQLTFVLRKIGQSFSAKRLTLDADAMTEKVSRLVEHIGKLQSLLSVSDDDLQEFGNVGIAAANKT
jgi:hypothetical protein